jgi:DNA invertase Pin-like site-specific DNA recombinase
MEWKTREESRHGSSNGKLPVREYVPKQSHTRLYPKQINDLVVAYQAGSTIKELAAQFHSHHTTLSNVLKRHGVPGRHRPLTPEQIEHAVEAYLAGSSSKMIGNLLGVDASRIWRTLRREGVNMRDSHGRTG